MRVPGWPAQALLISSTAGLATMGHSRSSFAVSLRSKLSTSGALTTAQTDIWLRASISGSTLTRSMSGSGQQPGRAIGAHIAPNGSTDWICDISATKEGVLSWETRQLCIGQTSSWAPVMLTSSSCRNGT